MAGAAILDVQNSLLMAFLTILNHTKLFLQTFFTNFFTKWPPAPISDVRNLLLIAFLAISDRYTTFFFVFDKMTAVGHFGCPRLTFDHFSGHFRTIRNFLFIFYFVQNGCRLTIFKTCSILSTVSYVFKFCINSNDPPPPNTVFLMLSYKIYVMTNFLTS